MAARQHAMRLKGRFTVIGVLLALLWLLAAPICAVYMLSIAAEGGGAFL